VTEEFLDAGGRRILKAYPVDEFDALSAGDKISARL
jgi:hypothetical protein